MIRKAFDWVKWRIARQKAWGTANANAAQLRLQGYQFVPGSNGFFYVYPPSDTPPYELQLYRDRTNGKMDYQCSCESWKGWGFCKHGIHQVEFIRSIMPEVRCAEAAPEPPAGFRRLTPMNNFAVARNAPTPTKDAEIGHRTCFHRGQRYQELDSTSAYLLTRDFGHDANDPRNERSFS